MEDTEEFIWCIKDIRNKQEYQPTFYTICSGKLISLTNDLQQRVCNIIDEILHATHSKVINEDTNHAK